MTEQSVQPSEVKWKLVPKETTVAQVMFMLDEHASSMGAMKVSTKWDGCTNLWLPENDIEYDAFCYHHICDLDEFIVYLHAVREKARAYFGGEFGLAPVPEELMAARIAAIQQEEQCP